MPPTSNRRRVGLKKGFRSGLEEKVAEQIRSQGLEVAYEQALIRYIRPQTDHIYRPDFLLPNGIYIETKGRFTTADRQKHLWIKEQFPDLDIRFVFTRSKAPLYKGSPTTYATWCRKHGFKFADKQIPSEWFKESRT